MSIFNEEDSMEEEALGESLPIPANSLPIFCGKLMRDGKEGRPSFPGEFQFLEHEFLRTRQSLCLYSA